MRNIRSSLRRWQTWVGIVVGAFALMLAYYFITGYFAPETPPAPGQQVMIMRGVSGQAQRAGALGWRFTADATNTTADGQVTTYYRAVATYYLNGKPAYRMTAPQVSVDLRSQDYTATGYVRVWSLRNAKAQNFHTDYIVWNQAGQLLSCPRTVHMTYNGMSLVTTRLSVNLRTGDTQLGKTSINSSG